MALARPVTKTIISTTDFGIPVVDAVNANTAALAAIAPGAFVSMTLLNGFSADGWTQGVRLRKIGTIVYCTGACQNVALGPASVTVFTIPVGYRPTVNTRINMAGYYGGGGEPQSGRGDVGADGNVNVQMTNNMFLINFNCFWFVA